jgi:hypothetical protein
VEEAKKLAPKDLRDNLNRLVVVSPEEDGVLSASLHEIQLS